jgi:hypothetical protein
MLVAESTSMQHFAVLARSASVCLALAAATLSCGDEEGDLECFVELDAACPTPYEARISFDLACGETISSVDSDGTRQGDLCCYEVSIARGECPDRF